MKEVEDAKRSPKKFARLPLLSRPKTNMRPQLLKIRKNTMHPLPMLRMALMSMGLLHLQDKQVMNTEPLLPGLASRWRGRSVTRCQRWSARPCQSRWLGRCRSRGATRWRSRNPKKFPTRSAPRSRELLPRRSPTRTVIRCPRRSARMWLEKCQSKSATMFPCRCLARNVTRCQGKNAHRYREKFVRLNQSESVFRCHLVNTKRWTSAKFNNIQEQCQVLTILRCRENSAERCQVRLALKFLCCSVFRCVNLAYHASLCSLESSFPLTIFPSSKKASDEVVYLGRDLLLSELAFKDSITKIIRQYTPLS